MASGEASIVVRLVDKATAGLKGIGGSLDLLKRNFLAVSAAVAGLTAFMASSVRAFSEQEVASKKLQTALRNQGITSKAAAKELEEYASSLQKTTTSSDEAITQGMALLTTFGLTGNALKTTTKAALDLSAGIGIDLHSAMMLLGKASQGQTEALGRYGIKVQEGLKGSEAFAAVLAKVNDRFGGAAQSQAQTFTGRMAQLSNSFNDLQERIGEAAIPVLKEWVRWGNAAIDVVSRMFDANNDSLSVNELALQQQRKELEILRRTFVAKTANQQITARSFESLAQEINAKQRLVREIERQVEMEKKAQEAKGGAGGREAQIDAESQKFVDAKRKEVEEYFLTEQEKAIIQAESDAKRLEALGQRHLAEQVMNQAQADANIAQSKREEDAKKTLAQERAAVVRDTLSALSSLSSAKSKELAAIGKAAAVAQATMDTHAAANRALAQGGFFGFAMAALVTAAGMANVARISGVKLAQGGVVMPRSGGTQAIIGEAGRSEAVIPLGDSRAQEQIREALGGAAGGVTINLYAQYADRAAFQEFVGKIDEELFRRRRNGKDYYS